MMNYKGYVAAVEYDDSVEALHGRVVNTGAYPIATFEATDAKALKAEFHRSIDEYLAVCEEEGVAPAKPFSGKLNVRLGADLHRRVAASASFQGDSINTWITKTLDKAATER